MEDFVRKWKNQISKFKSDSKIKECFHFDSDSCKGKIKSAHSLQKNGVLSLLEAEINKNNVVYSFLYPKLKGFLPIGFEPLGKKDASTFHGFCDFHDTTIFSEIENNPINIDSDKHCFLLCYRAFAKEYHTKIEINKGFKNNELYNEPQNQEMQEDMINGSELAIKDLKGVKTRLNNLLKDKKYNGLEYFTYSIGHTIPIACATSITPSYSYNGTLLNKSVDENDTYENVMITVLPTKEETYVIFGCFPEDFRSIKYIDELENLPDKVLENAITSILIGEVENTFISPLIWERMTKREREFLMQEIFFTSPLFQTRQEEFFISSLNLFDRKFAI